MSHLPQLREVTQRMRSLSNQFGCRDTGHRLHDCPYTKFGFSVFEISGDCVPRNAENSSDLPCGFTLSSPFETFGFAG
jgi:hypothetical protein